MSEDLWRWSATQLANAIASKTVSSREVVEAHLDRIGAVNAKVNAITRVLDAEALTAARAADEAHASGHCLGPLHGVPVTVKENIDVFGSPTTQGIVALKDWLPPQDAPVVSHLKAAGAIILGRTNLPDYGMRWHTDNALHGPTINPWNAEKTPGGSSGGEAAALATGMTPLGLGNDMGGSIRQPAICCGVTGLRPTTGRVSRFHSALFSDPPMFYGQIAYVNGPMARRICDLRLALKVIEQSDAADPVWSPAAAPPEPRSLRVGVVRDPSGDGLDAPVAKALERAVSCLKDAGYQTEDIDAPLLEKADETIHRLAETEFSAPSDLPPSSDVAASIFEHAMDRKLPDAFTYHGAIGEQYRIAAAWGDLMEEYPLIVGPVSSLETFDVGYDLQGPGALRSLLRAFGLTELCNLLGLPSVALPVLVDNGLPQGVQIIGRRFDDERCLAAAEHIEQRVHVSTPIDPVFG